MWETAEKIGFIVLIGVVMAVILRSSGELGARSLSVARPAHFEGQPPQAQGRESAQTAQHGSPSDDHGHGEGMAAYDRSANVGRQVLILVALLALLLGIVWIGSGSLGIFWY